MAQHLEKESTYLLTSLPEVVKNWKKEYTKDIYLPPEADHPMIRLRRRGESFFMTKKYPKVAGDFSTMVEETIVLTESEYKYFETHVPGLELEKNRYSLREATYTIEVDEYLGKLSPLIVMDIEWDNDVEELDLSSFKIGKDITQLNALAAGNLAGKRYEDIKEYLECT